MLSPRAASASFCGAKNVSRIHLKEPPAPSVQPRKLYWPGTAWHWLYIPWGSGSIKGAALHPNTTPEVPMVLQMVPGRVTPMPTPPAS